MLTEVATEYELQILRVTMLTTERLHVHAIKNETMHAPLLHRSTEY